MADFNDNMHKGEVLMQQALKKYSEGNYEGGDKDREEANRFFDLATAEINSEEGKLTQLYGESRNFGIIYNVFEQNMDKLFADNAGKKVIKEGFELIKNNKILSEQFKIYDFFEKPQKVKDVKQFVEEALNIVKHLDKNEVKRCNEDFIRFMRKNNLDEYVDIPEEMEKVYEAIEYTILNEKNLNNLAKYIKSQNEIIEYVEKCNKDIVNENKTNDELLNDFKNKVEEAGQKIDEEINDDEKQLIEAFTNTHIDREKLFVKYKEDALNKVNEMVNSCDSDEREQWENIYNKINEKKYSNNIYENISSCAEMLEICSMFD